ncbi:DUF898 domain-containing protein [Erysipelothrix sp. D19-032]|nr:DUF898 family protein [Erysipelothrix aquatica]
MKSSYFDGGFMSYLGLQIVNVIIVVITLGFGSPWAMVRTYRWEADHTVLEGNRTVFTGTAMSLFGQWIVWWLLTLVTFGIYGFFVHVKVLQWRTEHTYFVN